MAVLAVILLHGGILPFGWVGVNLFFVLSGYLISGILLDAKASGATWWQIVVPFYARRSLRILPLAWFTIFVVVAVTHQWRGAAWYASYLVNWLPIRPQPMALSHFWTLAVEEQFYLFWPFVLLLCPRRVSMAIVLSIVVIACLTRTALMYWNPAFASVHILRSATVLRADPLVAGALLALLERGPNWRSVRKSTLLLCCVSTAAAILAYVMQSRGILAKTIYVIQESLIALSFTSMLLLVIQKPPRWLQRNWLVYLGTISYGVYVIHGCFIPWLMANVEQPILRTALFLLSIPLAALSWRFFEAPILSLKRRWPMPRAKAAVQDAIQ